jgi:DNA polymerase-3 subunit delta'
MKFSEIIGQETVINILKHEFINGRNYQSYLFTGPEGVGKKNTAIALAQLINCTRLPDTDDPDRLDSCGECVSCRKISQLIHPDVEIITIEEKHKEILIEQIRELQRKASLKPMEGRRKVYIIDDADSMNRDSANCLLKTLEEPNEDVVVILLVRNLYGILTTVRSRCRIMKLRTIKLSTIKEMLVKECGLEADKALFIAQLSQGRMGLAKSYIEEEGAEKLLDMAARIMDDTVKMKKGEYPDYEKIFKLTDEVYSDRKSIMNMLNCLIVDIRSRFIKNPTTELKSKIDTVLNTQELISYNINAHTAISNMLIKLGN